MHVDQGKNKVKAFRCFIIMGTRDIAKSDRAELQGKEKCRLSFRVDFRRIRTTVKDNFVSFISLSISSLVQRIETHGNAVLVRHTCNAYSTRTMDVVACISALLLLEDLNSNNLFQVAIPCVYINRHSFTKRISKCFLFYL